MFGGAKDRSTLIVQLYEELFRRGRGKLIFRGDKTLGDGLVLKIERTLPDPGVISTNRRPPCDSAATVLTARPHP